MKNKIQTAFFTLSLMLISALMFGQTTSDRNSSKFILFPSGEKVAATTIRQLAGHVGTETLTTATRLLVNNPPVAINDTVYMCMNSTITIHVQNNDSDPDSDSLFTGIYAGMINGSFTLNGNAIDYTPNPGYTGTDTIVYYVSDSATPALSDTAIVFIHVITSYTINSSVSICNGDSIFIAGAFRTSSGVYTDSLSSAFGCDSTVVTTLTVNPSYTTHISVTICLGDSIFIAGSFRTTPGTYTDPFTSVNGCDSSIVTTLAVNPLPVALISASGPVIFCAGDSVILTANAGTSYVWSTGATTQSITVFVSGTYSVTVTNSCGSATSLPVVVTVSPSPTATITHTGPLTFCNGDSVTLTANLSYSYLWSTGATTQSITVFSSGNYTVTITNLGGCSATSAVTTVTVNPLPVATITPDGPTTFCEGDSVKLTAHVGSSYLWSTGATTHSITVFVSGNYSVTVTNGCGSATSLPTNVTVDPLPIATITPSGATTFCEGDSVILTANLSASYLWSTGATTQSIVVYVSGSYAVTVTNAAGCSATSSETIVTINTPPTATITPGGATTFCTGDSVILTASTGISYLWSTGAMTQSITVTVSGDYSVTVTNACGNSTSLSTTVTVDTLPVVSITASDTTTFCEGGSVVLTATTNTSYLWSTGATTQSITVNETGNYFVTVTNAAGCSATSAGTTVTVNPLPTALITPDGPISFCVGDSVMLTADSSVTYLWSTGDTTQTLIVTAAGDYSVTVSNEFGCTATSAITAVSVNPLPTATITASDTTTFCEGGSVILTATSGSSYAWSTGATTQSITVSVTGDYAVTVTNGCGSATSSPVSVTVNPLPTAIITGIGSTIFCLGDSVILTADTSASYLWSTGATTQSIVVYSSGNYSVTVSNGFCSATSTVTTVTVNPLPIAAFSSTPSGVLTVSFSDSSSYANTHVWSFGDGHGSALTNPTNVYASVGTYTVMLIVSNACGSDTSSQVIKVNSEIEFYNGFSPNGDGLNDFWNIPLLNYYPDNTVQIINRWGSEVWRENNYDNTGISWKGKNLNGDDLPDGTYYYIIQYNNTEKRGWVFIKR